MDNLANEYVYRVYVLLMILLAFFTDIADGWLARKYNEITEFGKIIDPLADKVFVAVLVFKLYLLNEIPGYYFWIIVIRDIVIFLGGIYVANIIGKILPSNLLGKITVFSIGLFLISVVLDIKEVITWLYNFLFYGSITLSFASVAGYAIRAIENVKWKRNEAV
jgi:CDP-diacylglycerol--glycerol-3-phosphate 3-phosphatidyltransferase